MISKLLVQIKNITKKNRVILLLCLIAIPSIFIRSHYILHKDPFNLDWTYSASLIHLDTMSRDTTLKTILAPTLTYPGGANHFIDSNSTNEPGLKGFVNSSGVYFYMSYPPLAFIAPFLIFSIFHIPIHIISLKFFALFIHILSAFLIYKLLYELTKKEEIALFSFSAYIYLPIALHWHTWIYFSDTAVHPFIIFGLYLLHKILVRQDDKKYLYIYALNLFLMCYTDWIGFIFAGVTILFLLFSKFRNNFIKIISANILVPVFAFGIIISQYAYVIGGYTYFFNILWGKYVHGYSRGGAFTHFLDKIHTIESHYGSILLVFLLFVFFFLIYLFTQKNKKDFDTPAREIILIPLVTVLMHHIVFFQWTSHMYHYYSVLKSMIFITIFISYVLYVFWYKLDFKEKRFFKGAIYVLFGFTYISSIYHYYQKVPQVPKDYSSSYCAVAREMSTIARSDQVIFIKDSVKQVHVYPLPTILPYCAKRNIEVFLSKESAKELLKKNKVKSGIVFTIQYSGEAINGFADIIKVEEIKI
ncbi:MAG: hypothetical protein RLZZ517_311 [Candidatus Parcubacteria bacterium]